MAYYPVLAILVGLAVLGFGRRLAVLGAAVGFLVGLGILHLFPGITSPWDWMLAVGLAVLGFVGGRFAKGFEAILVLVVGALGGAAIVLGFLDIFGANNGAFDWLLAVLGGVIGLVVARRFKDWAMLVLAGLVGGLLVVRGLTAYIPALNGWIDAALVVALGGGGIYFQSRELRAPKEAAPAPAPAPAAAPPPAPVAASAPPAKDTTPAPPPVS